MENWSVIVDVRDVQGETCAGGEGWIAFVGGYNNDIVLWDLLPVQGTICHQPICMFCILNYFKWKFPLWLAQDFPNKSRI